MASSRTKNCLIALFALTTVAGGLLAWVQYQQLIKLRAASLDDNARTDLQKRLWDLEKRKNELEAEVASLRARRNGSEVTAQDDPAADDNGGPRRRPGPGGFGRRGGLNNLSVLLDNPNFNKLWTQQQKDRIKIAYAGLFKNLNLTPDQQDKLDSLLVERQMSLMDVLAAARSQGISGRDQIGALMQQANSQIDSQIQSLLGPDGYSQYTNYLQTQPQRNQVSELQTRLAAAGVQPLQDYQAEQLTQILAQNGASNDGGNGFRGGMFAAMGGLGGMFGANVTGPTITGNAVTQATSVLTGDQLQTLQQMQQDQATQRQIMDALRQSFRGNAAPTAGAATPTAPPAAPTSPGKGG